MDLLQEIYPSPTRQPTSTPGDASPKHDSGQSTSPPSVVREQSPLPWPWNLPGFADIDLPGPDMFSVDDASQEHAGSFGQSVAMDARPLKVMEDDSGSELSETTSSSDLFEYGVERDERADGEVSDADALRGVGPTPALPAPVAQPHLGALDIGDDPYNFQIHYALPPKPDTLPNGSEQGPALVFGAGGRMIGWGSDTVRARPRTIAGRALYRRFGIVDLELERRMVVLQRRAEARNQKALEGLKAQFGDDSPTDDESAAWLRAQVRRTRFSKQEARGRACQQELTRRLRGH